MSVKVTRQNGETLEASVEFGGVRVLPMPVGEVAEAVIEPARGFDVGAGAGKSHKAEVHGGLSGIIIDCRGRPLALPQDDKERIESLVRWAQQLDAYPA